MHCASLRISPSRELSAQPCSRSMSFAAPIRLFARREASFAASTFRGRSGRVMRPMRRSERPTVSCSRRRKASCSMGTTRCATRRRRPSAYRAACSCTNSSLWRMRFSPSSASTCSSPMPPTRRRCVQLRSMPQGRPAIRSSSCTGIWPSSPMPASITCSCRRCIPFGR